MGSVITDGVMGGVAELKEGRPFMAELMAAGADLIVSEYESRPDTPPTGDGGADGGASGRAQGGADVDVDVQDGARGGAAPDQHQTPDQAQDGDGGEGAVP